MVDKLEFVGQKEIAEMAGVSATLVANWRKRSALETKYPKFPEPYVTLSCGSIWLKSDIETWLHDKVNTSKKLRDVVTRAAALKFVEQNTQALETK